ncbi:MAG: Protein of unknown function rane [Ramlibacter sp.]|nr:Protein of unknown function rane [Ramlibacter sp.]
MRAASRSRSRVWLGPLAFAAVFAIAFAVSWLIPPDQSPDEHSHLARAYMISQGHWLLDSPPGHNSGGMADSGFTSFLEAHWGIAMDAKVRLSDELQGRIAALRWGQPEKFYIIPGTGYYVPLIYAPHALGLWLGQALNLGIAHSYQLVRSLCLLSCLGLLAWAFRLLRPPVIASALLLLPMTLFQMLSPTLDGVTTCLAVLALSIFCRRLLGKEDLPGAYVWILAVSVALLASSRAQLLPLLGFSFYLAWSRRSKRDFVAGLAALLVSAGWTAYALTHTVDLRMRRAQSTGELLRHYAAHPDAFFKIVFDSLADHDLGTGYARSFIGVLGWLDTLLPEWSYQALWIGLGLCAAASLLAARPPAVFARATLAVAALAGAGLVFLAMLVTWTIHPATVVNGVQGRYFIVPAIILAYAIGAAVTPRGPRWPGWLVLCATAGVSFYAFIVALVARYH